MSPQTENGNGKENSFIVKDSFLDLEKHRQLLEENIEKLQKALYHWQTWEIEYEGLKEEILAAEPSLNRTQLADLAHEYKAELLTQKEVEDILGPVSRTAAQVVSLLDHRLDYVGQNIKTVQKQVDAADNKLAAATIISNPDVRNEEGLPLTEIMEELDDDGNIISSSVSTPGTAKPQLLEVLKKAGVKDLPAMVESNIPGKSTTKKVQPLEEASDASVPTSPSVNKGVKFAEDTKPGPESEMSHTAKRLEEIMRMAKESEQSSEIPVIPTNESAEDAALRREMLQYGASEIGAVVAELEIEEGSDWSDDEFNDYPSTDDDDDEEDEDEDQYGRTKKRVVGDKLRRRMMELEEKLGTRMMENVGKQASEPEFVKEGIGRITINGGDDNADAEHSPSQPTKSALSQSSPTSATSKKSVRFSETLDVSPAPTATPTAAASKKRTPAPVGDIVERTKPSEASSAATPKKASKFKADRSAATKPPNGPLADSTNTSPLSLNSLQHTKPKSVFQSIPYAPEYIPPPIAPSGPEGITLAPTIVERTPDADATVLEPDALDPHLLHQEVATEYHRMRNRMIQKQGGFVQEEESELIPLTEEEGGPKKVSRFKAARLARS